MLFTVLKYSYHVDRLGMKVNIYKVYPLYYSNTTKTSIVGVSSTKTIKIIQETRIFN